MKLTTDILKRMIRVLQHTKPDEIGCNECFEQLHRFAELELAGKSPEKAMPLVEDHLARCKDCREEYEALLEALKALKVPE